MTTLSQPIIQAALNLPEADRADIVMELIESLSPEHESLLDESWAIELDRRWGEFLADETTATDWTELRHEK